MLRRVIFDFQRQAAVDPNGKQDILTKPVDTDPLGSVKQGVHAIAGHLDSPTHLSPASRTI